VPRAELGSGIGVPALFVRAGLAGSNGEVRRAVANKAVRINDAPVADAHRTVTLDDLNPDGVVKLSLGRKKHVLVVPA
jgi:tyrosyl-tRNA synthetase